MHISGVDEYQAMYAASIANPDKFFADLATELVAWSSPFVQTSYGDFMHGNVAWFLGGKLNVAYNCIDRHAMVAPHSVAIVYEADEPGNSKSITYSQLLAQVCAFANALIKLQVRKGDIVAIYMPMVPEAAIAMLACARIGAVHSVIFAGFSAEAVRDRVIDAACKVIITADQGRRGGKTVHLKHIVDEAVKNYAIQNIIVFQRTADPSVNFQEGRDVWWHDIVANQRPYCPAESMCSEDPLFLLYTSGSTGKPKGVVHTQAGYLLGATATCKYVFDLKKGDVHGCMADIGWITGHTYIV